MAYHFSILHSWGTHEKSAMDCALAQVERDMNAITTGEAARRCAGEKGCTNICPCFTEQGQIVWKILVVHWKICYH
jgi:hypothetical protein